MRESVIPPSKEIEPLTSNPSLIVRLTEETSLPVTRTVLPTEGATISQVAQASRLAVRTK